MATPKKRTSVSRKGMRRAGQHHKLYAKNTGTCPNCEETVMPHHVCPSCGMYKGVEVIKLKVKAEEGAASEETNE